MYKDYSICLSFFQFVRGRKQRINVPAQFFSADRLFGHICFLKNRLHFETNIPLLFELLWAISYPSDKPPYRVDFMIVIKGSC